MTPKIAVIGLGDFGMSIALSVAAKGAEVVAIDRNMEPVEEIKDKVAYAAKLDSTDEKALKSLGIDQVDVVIISIGKDFESSILTSVLILQMGIKRVVARASSLIQEKIFKKLGVHQVVLPEFETAKRMASSLMNEDILDYVPLDDNYNIIQALAPASIIGKTLQEMDLRVKHNINLITIKRKYEITKEDTKEKISKERIYGVPTASTVVEEGDILIILGRDEDIKSFLDSE